MANQTKTAPAAKPQREPKFLLGSIFVDADVTVEPQEPAKIVVAGLTEAKIVKEYPEGFFKKAAAVFKGEMSTLFKSSLFFIAATLPFILVLLVAAGYFEDYILGGNYNFMADIGVGFPGGGDSIAESVARLYWDVRQPVLMMCAGAGLIAVLFMSGLFYCAKRCYFQDSYKRIIRTFFMGVGKYWWKFLVTGLIGILIAAAMGTALLFQLQQQQLGTATAGTMTMVVFTFLIGTPLLCVPMVMMSLFAVYPLSLRDSFKDALVIIVNNPLTVAITGLVSLAPLLLLLVNQTILSIIIYVAMAAFGFSFCALCWTAMADKGMTRCKALKNYIERKKNVVVKKGQKVVYDKPANDAPVKKKPAPKAQPYQNPKKKKKK